MKQARVGGEKLSNEAKGVDRPHTNARGYWGLKEDFARICAT